MSLCVAFGADPTRKPFAFAAATTLIRHNSPFRHPPPSLVALQPRPRPLQRTGAMNPGFCY